eukprot:CAMPEP_0196142872 /NCGR_PEP_ID=MMETSP0910-20130528/12471_1 /TAXON_ID=49265 /ORGANISM="Thalassiosira rotula, Strain GSO102" /LENGTH=72 /DNA_ID=CAMNT_0041404241 /DNA_START=552 /DNA_END=770 /DNA_ORIENTATION=-
MAASGDASAAVVIVAAATVAAFVSFSIFVGAAWRAEFCGAAGLGATNADVDEAETRAKRARSFMMISIVISK